MGYEKTNPPRVKSLEGPKFSKGAGRRHFKTEDSNEFPCRQDRAAASCRPITPTGGNYQLELALYYAGAGIPLHPVHPTAKCPLRGSHGKNDATTNEAQIRAWWKRYPDALVSILTGSQTGIFVLDVDGESGRRSLNELLTLFNFERIEDLTFCIVRSRSGGLHLYFRLRSGERPRSRAGDIAPGLDTKGEGGSIIAPGNRLPDGREYRWIGPRTDLAEASEAPAALIYLATFGARNRDEIANDPDLSDAIKVANAGEWPGIFEQHQKTQAARMMARMEAEAPDLDGMRAQAASDIREAAAAYAELADGRRVQLYRMVCRIGKYVGHGIVTEPELRTLFRSAAEVNGAISKHGRSWADSTITSALRASRKDTLPPLARRFRNHGDAA